MKRLRGLKIITIGLALSLSVIAGLFFLTPTELTAQDAKPLYKGTVYSATRGGHMVYSTLTIDPNKDLITSYVIGYLNVPTKQSADAIEMTADQKTIFYPTWDDSVLYTIDISDKRKPKIIAEKKVFDGPTRYCGSTIGPDGRLYFSSMALGDVHKLDISDPKNAKVMDRAFETTYLCGVKLTENGKYVWTTDMKDSKVYVYDAKTGKKVKDIKPGGAEFLHRSTLSPDGKILYQSSTGAVGGEPSNGKLYLIDTAKMKVTDTIVFGATYDVHDVATTPDGDYAIVAMRKTPPKEAKDSEYVVMNMKTRKPIGSVSLCKGCHQAMNIDPAVTTGREVYLCGIQVAWEK